MQKFVEVFGKEDHTNDTDPTNDFTIPIVPNFGNNDILPHNIFSRGPNRWTKKYTSVWEKFIPEEQRHAFERGGWFYVEVIPNKLAVFSLNTLYFFDSNSAVDGCADKSEPGYEQMEWLRIQLQFVRDRGMKAILMGHVPPARTESKRNWDETCWQKYTLWMRQYRDVVVGSMYGHMNLDHFLLQDSQDIDSKSMDGLIDADRFTSAIDDELSAQSSAEYLTELRAEWSELPDPPTSKSKRAFEENILDLPSDIDEDDMTSNRKKGRNRKGRANRRYLKKIGGRWGERYSVSLVSPSVIPKYFPTLRVMHYNITGLEHATLSPRLGGDTSVATLEPNDSDTQEVIDDPIDDLAYTKKPGVKSRRKHRKSKKKHKKPKKPKYVVPNPPSRSSPPGPAYSPQTLTWLGFTQYYANLTEINIDYDPHHSMSTKNEASTLRRPLDEEGDDGNDSKTELSKAHRKTFEYEVEYDTRNDSVFKLEDLTVKSWLNVARRIGEYKPESGDRMEVDRNNRAEAENEPHVIDEEQDVELEKHKSGKKKHRKHKKRKAINKVWFTFARRAYVNTRDDADLHERFGEEDLLST